MLPNGVCITFLLLFMIVWNEIKNINLPDIADDNQLKKLFSAVKTIASLSTRIFISTDLFKSYSQISNQFPFSLNNK